MQYLQAHVVNIQLPLPLQALEPESGTLEMMLEALLLGTLDKQKLFVLVITMLVVLSQEDLDLVTMVDTFGTRSSSHRG